MKSFCSRMDFKVHWVQLLTPHSILLYNMAAARVLPSLCMHSSGSRGSFPGAQSILGTFQFLGTFSSHPDRQEKPVTPQESLPWSLQVSMVPGIGLRPHLHGQETCYSGLNKEGAHPSYPTGSPEDSKPKWRMWGRPPRARLLLSFCSASFQRGSVSCL